MKTSTRNQHLELVRNLFDSVLERAPESRKEYLDELCNGDEELRNEVEALLEAYDGHDGDVRDVLERLPFAPYEDGAGKTDTEAGDTDPLLGATVSHYRIEEKLGGGGMGIVYRARDTRLNRTVALKFLHPLSTARPDSRVRLLHEARAASALDHTNVGVIHEIGETDSGQLFIAMAYYEGETLKERIARGPLGVDEVRDIITQIAEGLSRAHEAGIVHRDVKPANVIVTKRGVVKLVDFGLAKVSDITSITRDGSTPGTIAYMSPEQTRGEELDARTDVWSLGVVSYEMLTGERPFQGDNSDIIIFGIRHDQPRSLDTLPDKVPKDLASIVWRMLEKDREDRYATAGEVLADLRSGKASPKTVSISSTTRHVSIALLPLVSMTRDPEQEWFTDGMTDALITDLAKVTGLRIISLGSVMPYKDTTKAPPQIAKELGVDYLVEGSIARLDDEIKVSARLIDASEDRYLWAESYERPFASTLRLQGEIARSIASQIRIELTPGEEKRFSRAHTVDPVTHEMYLKGMYHLNKFTPDGMERGLDYLSRAVERSPDDSHVHAGLALGYMLVAHTPSPPPETIPNARKAIQRALDLDADVAEVHLSLAMISVYSDWEREAGKRAYERALELNPSLAMAHAHSGWLHAVNGEVEEGLSCIRQAQSLDPLNAIHSAWLGELYFLEGYFDEAIEEALKAVELNPDFPIGLFVLGAGYAAKGLFDEAIEMHEKAAATGPDYSWCLGETYALAGDVDRAREIAATIENKPTVWDSYGLARIYRAIGDVDMVFHWLEAGYRQRHPYIQWFQLPGNFGTLHDDPRYGNLADRLGLPS